MDLFSTILCGSASASTVISRVAVYWWIPLTQRPVTRRFVDISFDLILNKRLSKQRWGWWFVTPSHPLWSHCNDVRANMAMVSDGQFLFRRKHFGGLLAYNKITMTCLIEFRISHIFLLSVDFVGNFAKYLAVLFKCKRIEVATTLKSPAENYWGCMLIGYGYWILLWFTQAYFLSYWAMY